MKKLSNWLFAFIPFLLLYCQDSTNTKSGSKLSHNLSTRAEPLEIIDIQGNYRGSYTDNEYGFRLAIKLVINKDGTYKKIFFSEGDPIDSSNGKIEMFVESNDKTDNYGENKVTTYLHGIKLNFNSNWGYRTEVYKIQNSNLIPVISFDDSSNDIILRKE